MTSYWSPNKLKYLIKSHTGTLQDMNSTEAGLLLGALPLPVALVDVAGKLVLCNSAWATAFDSDVDRVRGIAIAEHLLLKDPTKLKQALGKLAAKRSLGMQLDCEMAAEIGQESRWVTLTLRRFETPSDGVDPLHPMIAVSAQDVSEERALALHAAQSEARLGMLCDQINVGILIFHPNGELLLSNSASAMHLGISQAAPSLPGLTLDELLALATFLTPVDRTAMAGAHPETVNRYKLIRPNADIIHISVKINAIQVDGDAAGGLWLIEPIDHHGNSLRANSTDSGPLVEMIGQELAVVVEGATAAAIRAEQMEVDESLVSVLDRIRMAAEAAFTGIGGLVDMSGSRRSVGEGQNSTFRLRHFIANILQQVMYYAEEHNVRIRVRVEQDVAEHLMGDSIRLRHSLKTLMECALQTRPSEISLTVEAEFFNETSMTARFCVTSSVDRSASKARLVLPPMNPVRLAIAQYAVAAQGSELQREGNGTTSLSYFFSLSLALGPKSAEAERLRYVSLNGMPVLIVSSNAKQRLQLSTWLKAMRMLPMEADNAAMALALLTRLYEEGNPVPLVILENNLPVQDGFVLGFRIKHDNRLEATHIVMLASNAKRGDALACRESGIVGYLPQPVGKSRLADAIMAVTGATEEIVSPPDIDSETRLVTRHSLHDQRKGATVLLVDNDPASLELAEVTLRKHDAALVVANNRDDALTMAASDIYDVILVCVDLPDLSPESFVKSLKERLVKDVDTTPLIAISKTVRNSVESQCMAWGFTGVMFKPLERDELIALITKVSRLKKLAREQTAA